MDFVTIDFEIATPDLDSPCEIGLTVVRSNKILETRSWLVKPKQYPVFNDFNVRVHGIKPKDVENAPGLNDLWTEIQPFINDKFVIAHNARFDIGVLRRTLNSYSIENPTIDYACSYLLSRSLWKGLPSYNLKSLCKQHGIKLGNHRAGEDSRACAELTLKIFSEAGIETINTITEKLKVSVGRLLKNSFSPSEIQRVNSTIARLKLSEDTSLHKPDSIFYGKNVVFTGTLSSMTRDEALDIITMIGGIGQTTLNKSTNYLVVGEQDYRVVGDDGMSTKQEKAIQYIEKGVDIEIISENDFLRNV
jgi:DNA polymerase-3 subunit epsilon